MAGNNTSTTGEKGTLRARWRQCAKCPPERKPHKVFPKIYHETLLPSRYSEGSFVCEDCLEAELTRLKTELSRIERLSEAIDRELNRRDQVYEQLGY